MKTFRLSEAFGRNTSHQFCKSSFEGLYRGSIYKNMAAEIAYCVKCREKREMKDAKEVSMPGKGGERRAMTGLCTVCGTKMFKILGKKK